MNKKWKLLFRLTQGFRAALNGAQTEHVALSQPFPRLPEIQTMGPSSPLENQPPKLHPYSDRYSGLICVKVSAPCAGTSAGGPNHLALS